MADQEIESGGPLWRSASGEINAFKRATLSTKDRRLIYSEGTIQDLVNLHPNLIPIDLIEPAFSPVFSVAKEIPTAHGFVDNLFITPEGGLLIGECKLWRNEQSRREVVAQCLDYAAAISAWSPDDLNKAIAKAGWKAADTIWDVVSAVSPLSEDRFYDAVSRRLRRSELVLLVIGDGIRSEAMRLANFVQGHAGARYTIAFVEIAIWLKDSGEQLILPSVPMKTTLLERGVVRIAGEGAIVESVAETTSEPEPGRAKTLTEDEFYAAFAEKNGHEITRRLKSFADIARENGFWIDFQRTLNFKYNVDGFRDLNLGYVYRDGRFSNETAYWYINGFDGYLPIAEQYVHKLAELIGGGVSSANYADDQNWTRDANGKSPQISEFLDHQDAFLAAMIEYRDAARELIDEQFS